MILLRQKHQSQHLHYLRPQNVLLRYHHWKPSLEKRICQTRVKEQTEGFTCAIFHTDTFILCALKYVLRGLFSIPYHLQIFQEASA